MRLLFIAPYAYADHPHPHPHLHPHLLHHRSGYQMLSRIQSKLRAGDNLFCLHTLVEMVNFRLFRLFRHNQILDSLFRDVSYVTGRVGDGVGDGDGDGDGDRRIMIMAMVLGLCWDGAVDWALMDWRW